MEALKSSSRGTGAAAALTTVRESYNCLVNRNSRPNNQDISLTCESLLRSGLGGVLSHPADRVTVDAYRVT